MTFDSNWNDRAAIDLVNQRTRAGLPPVPMAGLDNTVDNSIYDTQNTNANTGTDSQSTVFDATKATPIDQVSTGSQNTTQQTQQNTQQNQNLLETGKTAAPAAPKLQEKRMVTLPWQEKKKKSTNTWNKVTTVQPTQTEIQIQQNQSDISANNQQNKINTQNMVDTNTDLAKANVNNSGLNTYTQAMKEAMAIKDQFYWTPPSIEYDLDSDETYKAAKTQYNQASSEALDLEEQINANKRQYDDIYKQTKAEYAGATDAFIRAKAAARQETMLPGMNSLIDQYNAKIKKAQLYQSQVNDIKENYTNEYNAKLKQYEIQFKNDEVLYWIFKATVDHQNDVAKADLDFQRDLQKKSIDFQVDIQKMQQKDKIDNGDIYSTDPVLIQKAVSKQVTDLMKQYDWLPFARSGQQISEDITNQILSGVEPGKALTSLVDQIRWKPEYKNWLWNKTASKPVAIGDYIYEMVDGERKPTGKTDAGDLNDIISNFNWPDQQAFAEACYSMIGKDWYQCWAFANTILSTVFKGENKPRFTNTVQQKITEANKFKSDIPQVGGAVVFDYGKIDPNTGENYWHVAVITKIEWDKFEVVEWNYNEDGKVTKRLVRMDDKSIRAYTQSNIKTAWTELLKTAVEWVMILPRGTDKEKQTALNDVKTLMANWNIDGARSKLLNQYYKSIWVDASKSIKADFMILDTMESLANDLTKVPTGYLKWGLEKTAQYVWQTSDPALAKLNVALQNAMDILRRKRSWAALTEWEEVFYNRMMPSIEKSFNLNKATMQGLVDTLQSNLQSELWTAFGDKVYNSLIRRDVPINFDNLQQVESGSRRKSTKDWFNKMTSSSWGTPAATANNWAGTMAGGVSLESLINNNRQ